MNIVDSSGWLEYFAEGNNANFFAPAIEDTRNLLLATARVNNATLWTQDEHFKDLEGVKYIKKK